MSLAVTPVRPKWKADLIQMGFPKKQIQVAAEGFTTLRQAVEWLCAQDAQLISESVEPGMLGSSAQKKSHRKNQKQFKVRVAIEVASPKKVRLAQSVKVNKSQEQAHAAVQKPLPCANTRAAEKAAAKISHLKSSLQEMGFPVNRIEAATQQYTTVRQAVEWLCSQEDDNIWVPVDQANEGATRQVESSQHEQEATDEVPVELQGSEANAEVELQGSEANVAVASSERKQPQQRKRRSTDGEPVTPLSRFASTQIPSPQRIRSNAMPPEALGSGTPTQVASPQLEPQCVAQPNDRGKAQTTLCDDLQQDVIDKRIIETDQNSAMWTPRSFSRRTSLGSLLTVPAETWSADQLQAALRQLHSFGSQRYESPVRTFTRRRLRCKQSVPFHPSTSPGSCTSGVQQSKRKRLRFKQSSPVYPPMTPNSSTGQSLAESSRDDKLPKSFAKWSALLLDMGFPADQVDSNLRKYKSLQKAIDALC